MSNEPRKPKRQPDGTRSKNGLQPEQDHPEAMHLMEIGLPLAALWLLRARNCALDSVESEQDQVHDETTVQRENGHVT